MNPNVEQILTVFKEMPLSKKATMAAVVIIVVAGFISMFIWANKVEYQTLYTNLAPEDAAEIVTRLKEQKIPYKLSANGNIILVPVKDVHNVRLSMAGDGLPTGGDVGFEIFDESDFGMTEFVQKLNYNRALQGELARTIKEFREVLDARVMIVLPKESLFIEESTPPTASVLLKLRSALSKEKISAVVNLVASSVQGLTPERITIVDTTGRVLSKGMAEEKTGTQANSQLEFKMMYEQNLARRIQTMLEKIVGIDKAIVRVNADMDFSEVSLSEEIFDPDGQVIRSRQNITESSDKKSGPVGTISSVNPIAQTSEAGVKESADIGQRQDETTNYEINKTIRQTIKQIGAVVRLSVAAVLDGNYEIEIDSKGSTTRRYIARSADELAQFTTIIKNAMGYNADREDQISVESFPFSYMEETEMEEKPGFDWKEFMQEYGRSIFNIFLVLIVFMFVIRPLVKGIKEIKTSVTKAILTLPTEEDLIAMEKKRALPEPELGEMLPKDRAAYLAKLNTNKTSSLVKSWIGENG